MLALAGPRVTVTPSGPEVPENLLRIALHPDAPLASPLDMRHVALFDGDGKLIDGAFLDLPLNEAGGQSVTLLLHPGRIKTGVGPNLGLGPALRAGQAVVLKIDDPQLGRVVEKHWRVVAPLRQRIDPQRWTVHAVKRGGRQPLRVNFPDALDSDAAALLALQAPDGKRLAGGAQLLSGEREWRFTPQRIWRPGRYLLRVHPRLEDPQGNRLCSAFEQTAQSAQPCDGEATLEFIID
ncbi:hypothetical protein [Rugamonas aquatica]|uniref:Uncharacterized protein n=1 Tax=Rugamonas aquatica TaxID=2743357 RepID=A0A6A7N2W0_9BURK|nr:hypothetical protein [Rugamonas aquatica]MQA39353.1 hypothetical protein [Rugamonas aquatica]